MSNGQPVSVPAAPDGRSTTAARGGCQVDAPVPLSPKDWDSWHRTEGVLVTEVEKDRFLKMVPSVAGMRIADVGCGTGAWTRQLARWGATVTGYDYSPEALRQAQLQVLSEPAAAVRYERWDVNSQPIPRSLRPCSLDLVTFRLSLAYLDAARVLADATRWLARDGALFILTSVGDPQQRGQAQPTGAQRFHRGIPAAQLEGLLAESRWDRISFLAGKRCSALLLQGPRGR